MAYSHELGAEAVLLLEHGATPIFLQHPCSRNQRLLCSLFKTSKQVSAIIEVPCSRLLEATYKPPAAKHPAEAERGIIGDIGFDEWLAKMWAITNSAELSAHLQLFITWLDKHRASVKQLDLSLPDYNPQLLGQLQQLLGKHGGLVKALNLGHGHLMTEQHLAPTAAVLQVAVGLQLQSLHVDLAKPDILQHLPAASLTSLVVRRLEPGDGHSTTIPQALAALSNLRMLHLGLPCDGAASNESSVVNALSSLTNLTNLALAGLKAPDMSQLPTQLLELDLDFRARDTIEPFFLGQLTALTKLKCNMLKPVFEDDGLPPNLVHLSVAEFERGAPLQRLTKLKKLIIIGSYMPAADLCSVAAHLTNLTQLDLCIHDEEVLTQAAAAFPFLPALVLHVWGDCAGEKIVLSSSVIQQLNEAPGLQRLALDDVLVEATEADFRGVLQQRSVHVDATRTDFRAVLQQQFDEQGGAEFEPDFADSCSSWDSDSYASAESGSDDGSDY